MRFKSGLRQAIRNSGIRNLQLDSGRIGRVSGCLCFQANRFEITITKDGNTLIAQATGQSAFPLEATEKDKFKFDRAGVVLEFSPADNTMILKQGGGQFTFTRE